MARFPLTTLFRRIRAPAKRLSMPPAPASLATEGSADVDPAVLSVTRVFTSVRTPPLSIPPPALKPHARGPQKPGGIVENEVTVLPVITVFEIVTVAPVPLKGGWSS